MQIFIIYCYFIFIQYTLTFYKSMKKEKQIGINRTKELNKWSNIIYK